MGFSLLQETIPAETVVRLNGEIDLNPGDVFEITVNGVAKVSKTVPAGKSITLTGVLSGTLKNV